jgi:hypothetical protein
MRKISLMVGALALLLPSFASATLVSLVDNTIYSSECGEGGEVIYVFSPVNVGEDDTAVLYPEVSCGTPFELPVTPVSGQVVHVGVGTYYMYGGFEAGTLFGDMPSYGFLWQCGNTSYQGCPFDFVI